MAHKKAGSTANTNRDSQSKRLGLKLFGGEVAKTGNIILRQKGNKFYAGEGARQGNDYTIFAMRDGKVQFKKKVGKSVVMVV